MKHFRDNRNLMEYNPVQTNQRSWKEALVQRLWEYVRVAAFGLTPWFARRWRIGMASCFRLVVQSERRWV